MNHKRSADWTHPQRIISHRITTLMQTDNVLVLEKGRVSELGTPEKLRTAGGIFQKVYDMQTAGMEAE